MTEGRSRGGSFEALDHAALPAVGDVRDVERAGKDGGVRGERAGAEEAQLADLDADKAGRPVRARALDSDDRMGAGLVVEGVGERTLEAAGLALVGEGRARRKVRPRL